MSHNQRPKGRLPKVSDGDKSKYFEGKDANSETLKLAATTHPDNENLAIITELRQFRQEVAENLQKLSDKVSNFEQAIQDLSGRVSEAEDRVGSLEEDNTNNSQLLSYLIRRERQLDASCDALENAQRRSNLRIYGIKEGCETGDNAVWIEQFLRKTLKLPDEFDAKVERAHTRA